MLKLASLYLARFDIGTLFFPETYFNNSRYILGDSLKNIISYPLDKVIVNYIQIVFNGGIFHTLSYFVLGYYFAKKGIIEHLEDYVKLKPLILIMLLYISLLLLFHFTYINTLLSLSNLFGSLFYAMLFIYVYNCKSSLFTLLEPFGRMGLTNYSFQSIIGVILMVTFLLPNKIGFDYIVLCFIFVYVLQVLFSILWLNYFKYGPLEWLWRCFTNMKFNSPFKTNIFFYGK
ncbi:DUF418 domain-containing protein [Bacteroides sp.]|uniref:DUF418 domain-containing protein n=1 Tax=Bacteroides sp. TaxID=29523 RepID=UPI00261BBA7E|nr:DUF418 domain-containing protein [Bacteroides sp.]MDD3037988.1 DUF418 domain-containing protein [Bacteroides sp.]